MSESVAINQQAFRPYNGGEGKRLSVTSVSASVAIPGLEGGVNDNDKRRVFVTNNNAVSVFVRMGNAIIAATTDSLEILPGCGYLLTPPFVGPSGVWLAAVTVSGSAAINVCAGEGM